MRKNIDLILELISTLISIERIVVAPKDVILTICMTCRDEKETSTGTRGGTRLAKKILKDFAYQEKLCIRGVDCMSNCKRACAISITAKDCFTYIFGDLDPDISEHRKLLAELLTSYRAKNDGFLRRRDRPKFFQSNILGRLPPIDSTSSLITNLQK